MLRRPLFVMLACALALGAGCGPKVVQRGGVLPEKRYRNVVSLAPGTTEIIEQYCNGSQILKGRTAADDYPGSVESVPVVASVRPDFEKIKSVGADLVVYDSLLLNPQDVSKLKSLDVDTFAIDAQDVSTFITEIYRLGGLLGGETNVSDYVDRIENARSTAQGDAITPKPKVAVIMPAGGGAYFVNGTDSFLANAIRDAGGDPVGPKADRFVPLNAEEIVAANPDAIFVPVNAKDKAKAVQQALGVLNDPRFKSITAIHKGKITGFDEDVMLRRGGRVDQLIDKVHKFLLEKS